VCVCVCVCVCVRAFFFVFCVDGLFVGFVVILKHSGDESLKKIFFVLFQISLPCKIAGTVVILI
jgi:hypothetical protein